MAVASPGESRSGSLGGSLSGAVLAALAARPPGAVALSDGTNQVTTGELRARILAQAARVRGWVRSPGDFVGVHGVPSCDLVIAILGVLHAGAAYLPLDPDLPAARVAFMLRDGGCCHVIGDAPLDGWARGHVTAHPMAQEAGVPVPAARPAVRPEAGPPATSPAYAIYTSGSTGRPKGVLVGHDQVLNLLRAARENCDLRATDTWALAHSPAFDFSVWEIFGALTCGARLVIVPAMVRRSPAALLRLVRAERVTVLNQTPSAFRRLTRAYLDAGRPPTSLRMIVLGGEAARPADLHPWFDPLHAGGPRLVNTYGITETTVFTTTKTLTGADLDNPIGTPLDPFDVHLVDERLRAVPDGTEGEICVSGAGVALGYLGRPALTAARFPPNPFGAPGERMYRSGDYGVRRPDGELRYRGRLDGQVKIAGFRVEFDEIEAALSAQPGVLDAAVTLHTGTEINAGTEPRLVAHVLTGGAEPDAPALRAALAGTLPPYEVPTVYLRAEAIPLTPNGKIDRTALAAVPVPDRAEQGTWSPPETARQVALAAIWSDILGVPRIGIDDDFFAAGGDSIRLVSAVGTARMRGIPVGVEDVFAARTIRAIDRLLDTRPAGDQARHELPPGHPPALADPPTTGPVVSRCLPVPAPAPAGTELPGAPDSIEDSFPATAMQQGLIFHGEMDQEMGVYRDFAGFVVTGRYDPAAFRAALDTLSRRHAALRTSFDLTARSGPRQVVHRTAVTPLHEEYPGPVPRSTLITCVDAWRRRQLALPPEVSEAPLIRVCVVASPTEFAVDIALHHSILDGWSLALYLDELLRTYAAAQGGAAEPGRPVSTTMRAAVEHESEALASAGANRYWTGVVARLRDLPHTIGRPPRAPGEFQESYRSSVLPAEVTRRLDLAAARLRVPTRTLLLAAHLWSVGIGAGWEQATCGVVVNARPAVEDGARVLGLFVNLLPVTVPMAASFDEFVTGVITAEQRQLPHRHYPLAAIQRMAGVPLFDVVFNYTDFHQLAPLARGEAGIKVDGWRYWDRTQYALSVELDRLPDHALRIDLKRYPPAYLSIDLAAFERTLTGHLRDLAR